MSYDIVYAKAGIKTSKGVILLIQTGSNNCFQLRGRREVPEKRWGVIPLTMFHKEHKNVYVPSPEEAAEEIRQHWGDYTADGSESEWASVWKTRNQSFKKEELAKWVAAGIRNAVPLEDYIQAGNHLEVFGYLKPRINGSIDTKSSDFSIHETTLRLYPRSNEELVEAVSRLQEDDRVGYIKIAFLERDIKSPLAMKRKKKEVEERNSLREYFVLSAKGHYFEKRTKCSIWCSNVLVRARIFKTQAAAQKYLDEHTDMEDFSVSIISVNNS